MRQEAPVTSDPKIAQGVAAASDEATITTLSNQTRAHPEVVKDLYREEMRNLESTAKVKNFIGVIAGRRVKARLKRKSKSTAPA